MNAVPVRVPVAISRLRRSGVTLSESFNLTRSSEQIVRLLPGRRLLTAREFEAIGFHCLLQSSQFDLCFV